MMCYPYQFKRKSRITQTALMAFFLIFVPVQWVNAQTDAPLNPEAVTPVQAGAAANGARIMAVTAHPEATRAAYQVLKNGGSAADAAVAAQLVLGLVEPQSSGIGGGGFALYYNAATKEVHTFDGRETAPSAVGKYLFRGEDGKPMKFYDAAVGGRAVGVPGMVRLLEMLHGRFGVKPWGELFVPAIGLADNGFTVTPRLASLIDQDAMKLKNFIDTKLYFFPDAVHPVEVGDKLENKPYATVLRRIAEVGPNAFYTGNLPEKIVKTVREDLENPGLLSVEDFESYKAVERKTVCGNYRAHMICTAGEPSSGGLMLLAALGILENFNLAAMGPEDPQSWHYISEASRLAFADRNYYMGDPSFVLSPGERLIDKAYLKQRAALISAKPMTSAMPGTPDGWKQMMQTGEPVYPKPPGTTHISIVDAKGNIVSMTSSVEDMFGSRMMVDGFVLNNQLTDFSFVPEVDGKAVANRVEAGKRPRSTMTPVIMFSPNGPPSLVIGSAGGSAIMGYVLERIVRIVDWSQDLDTAVSAPNIVNRGKGIEMEFMADKLEAPLKAIGHPVQIVPLNSGITAIQIQNGMMRGVADPRREGSAMGE